MRKQEQFDNQGLTSRLPKVRPLESKKHLAKFKTGFTLVELMVVFFIMASILAVVIPGYLGYSTQLDLENLALDVALTMREAQSYGSGSKVSSGGTFDTSYGVHFVKGQNTFIIFENIDNTGVSRDAYSLTDNIISSYEIKNGYTIDAICTSSAPEKCDEGYNTTPIPSVIDIVFKRANLETKIKIANDSDIFVDGATAGDQSTGDIVFISPDRKRIKVRVQNTGNMGVIK